MAVEAHAGPDTLPVQPRPEHLIDHGQAGQQGLAHRQLGRTAVALGVTEVGPDHEQLWRPGVIGVGEVPADTVPGRAATPTLLWRKDADPRLEIVGDTRVQAKGHRLAPSGYGVDRRTTATVATSSDGGTAGSHPMASCPGTLPLPLPRSHDDQRQSHLPDIAHLAGVSQPTVSRALRGSPMVNAETRERILRIARELNYKVDKNASSLRLRNAGTLALLFFEDPTNDDSLINPFFHSMLGSITRACALHGQDLLVSFQQLSTDWQADYEDSNKADGIILLGYGDYHESRDRLQRLVEQGTHFVRWGAALPGQPGVSIGSDNFRAGMTSPPTCCSRAAAASPSSAMPPAITPNSGNATAATSRPCRTTAWPPNRRCSTMRSPPRLPARRPAGAAGA